ncbi:NAD(P)H-binding protein [Nocardiopsis potens]|uniref:NAD(P)H-binding protein n=1 Tax=Nocardiopsis potens TaxID=1246458 RepID=UPI00034884AE|nr:NAD(P)H-binding protein [Nocardiopsis potens]
MSDILVTGATGSVGRRVAAGLLAEGASVRALVRDPAAALPEGAEAAAGDLAAPETLDAALEGVGAVFLIWPFLDTAGAPAVLEAVARRARRVVYLSSSEVDRGAERQSDPITGLHAGMERLVEAAVPEWTVLRSETLASNARGWAGQIRASGVVRGPDIAPAAVVHEGDVAAAAVRALTGEGHRGAGCVLTGPQVLSRADQVRAIGEAVGRPLRFEAVPVREARERMLADGRPPALVEALLAAAETRPDAAAVTAGVRELTGAPPRSFAEWARENAALFR